MCRMNIVTYARSTKMMMNNTIQKLLESKIEESRFDGIIALEIIKEIGYYTEGLTPGLIKDYIDFYKLTGQDNSQQEFVGKILVEGGKAYITKKITLEYWGFKNQACKIIDLHDPDSINKIQEYFSV